MRLVACKSCHAQYDVSAVEEPVLECRCGQAVRNEALPGQDARIQRCAACGAILADGADTCAYCSAAVVRDARSLSLICPECYARNAESARFCTGCGVAFLPEPLPHEQEEPPHCPTCDGLEAMAVRGVGGVWVWECGKCNGLWVPGERLDALIQRAVGAAREGAARGVAPPPRTRSIAVKFAYRSCPSCGHQMQRRNFGKRSGVIVDWCGQHGTWLDKDELEQIGAFVAAGGMREAGGGITTGTPLSYEQARALCAVQNELERERRKAESQGAWGQRSATGGGLELILDVLGRFFK